MNLYKSYSYTNHSTAIKPAIKPALAGQGRLVLRTRAVLNFTIGDTRHPVVASIEVEDDGPGIPEELQDSVFYPLVTGKADGIVGPATSQALSLFQASEGVIADGHVDAEAIASVRKALSSD